MSSFTPTPEQEDARRLFASGESVVIEALAGTGKTSTLELLGADARVAGRKGRYIAFNKAIVVEAGEKMPGNVACSTAHSMAFRALGVRYAHRLKAGRMKSEQIARKLGVDPLSIRTPMGDRRLAPGWLAGHVVKTVRRFCQTADEAPTAKHVPYVDGLDEPHTGTDGKLRRGYANNDELARFLMPFVAQMWADVQSTDGVLPFSHDCYLKMWQLTHPRSVADFIFFDEAQDANPVMAAIVAEQADHSQLVYVGDSQQAIYEFTGAVNAMSEHKGSRTSLTQSFRFGAAVAEIANRVLETLTDLRVIGTDSIASSCGPIAEPDAILCRTNATAVGTVLQALAEGRLPHLVGGADDVVSFTRAAKELQQGQRPYHPDLSLFETWNEVKSYVDQDPTGDDLKLLVDLIETHGCDTILKALDGTVDESRADLIVSTAHKSKGREWASVQLAGDFRVDKDDPREVAGDDGERRLLYVSVTRAKLELDAESVPWVVNPLDANESGTEKITLPSVSGEPSCCLHHDDRHGVGVCCIHSNGCPVADSGRF